MLVLSCGDGTVEPAPPRDPVATTVAVNPASATLTSFGETTRFTAEVRDQNGNAMAGATMTWLSSDSSVAAVDASGLVTAVANGSTTVTATAGSASGTAAVTVAQEVSAVRIVEGDGQVGAQGGTLPVPLVLRLVDGNEQPVAGARLDFVVDDLHGTVDPASVVSDGLGQAKASWTLGMVVGRQTLTATAGEASASFTATAIAILTSFSVDPPSLAPAEAGKQGSDTIYVTVTDATGAPVADAHYRWTTDRNSGWVFPP
jgi:hypothetical protein